MSKPSLFVVVEIADFDILNVSAFRKEETAYNFATDIAIENLNDDGDNNAAKYAIADILKEENKYLADKWEVHVWPIDSIE